MNLYIMRHGEAEQVASNDSQRALTSRGVQEAYSAGQWLASEQNNISLALVSPFTRTQQTYDSVIKAQTVQKTLTLDLLRPDEQAEQVQDYIDGLLADDANINSILLVSHMPLVCYLVESFTGEHGPLFATASIVEIDYDAKTHRGQLLKCFHVPTID
ncbi:phosphohistidine phosphatase SixA [Alteromonadaceae bacterium BrNp21-10]|nr:phosphohistidine phosphatase SixA [Alteromonadaceae bacterium BrNp21-10]